MDDLDLDLLKSCIGADMTVADLKGVHRDIYERRLGRRVHILREAGLLLAAQEPNGRGRPSLRYRTSPEGRRAVAASLTAEARASVAARVVAALDEAMITIAAEGL
jgi:predicted ArsR family transcriptional regulator